MSSVEKIGLIALTLALSRRGALPQKGKLRTTDDTDHTDLERRIPVPDP